MRNPPAPWINDDIKYAMAKRDVLKRKHTVTKSEEIWLNLKRARNLCNRLCRDARRRYIKANLEECPPADMTLWNHLRDLAEGETTNMEKELEAVCAALTETPNVSGCIFADHQGLCLAAQGAAHVDSAGIVVAISEQACKLHPELRPPTVNLESDTKQCLIQRHGTITGAIFKNKT